MRIFIYSGSAALTQVAISDLLCFLCTAGYEAAAFNLVIKRGKLDLLAVWAQSVDE